MTAETASRVFVDVFDLPSAEAQKHRRSATFCHLPTVSRPSSGRSSPPPAAPTVDGRVRWQEDLVRSNYRTCRSGARQKVSNRAQFDPEANGDVVAFP